MRKWVMAAVVSSALSQMRSQQTSGIHKSLILAQRLMDRRFLLPLLPGRSMKSSGVINATPDIGSATSSNGQSAALQNSRTSASI